MQPRCCILTAIDLSIDLCIRFVLTNFLIKIMKKMMMMTTTTTSKTEIDSFTTLAKLLLDHRITK